MMTSDIVLEGRILVPSGDEYDCVVICRSPSELEIVGQQIDVGAKVLCHVNGLGPVETVVATVTEKGALVELIGSGVHRARIAARIQWHRLALNGGIDHRAAIRVIPSRSQVQLRTADGETLTVELIDVSSTGAALRTPFRAEIGAKVTIGRRQARVVRHSDDGMAVAFVLPLRPQDVTRDIRL